MRNYNFLQIIPFVILVLGLILTSLDSNSLYAEEKTRALNLVQSSQEKARHREKAALYTATRATSEIKIDGVLGEQAWIDAVVLKVPYEWSPGDNTPSPVDTDCLVTYNDDYFYVAFRCYDPNPSKIRAHLMDRDAIDTFIQDDHISIMIDPFNDERRGFQFRVNPLGVQADANFSEMEGYEDFSWDAIWNSAGKIADWGYGIEIAFPFNQLRFPRTSEVQTWGFSAERSYPRNVRHRMTSHKRERDVNCIMCQFNKITGIQGISPGLNLEIDSTLTANRTDTREDFPQGPMKAGDADADPGITARWGVTPNIILNATVNPDFSQVEADVAQLEVNTRFALYYPEKRPFFLEGADFFLTPFEAVFTRTVADPAGGIKLTGKAGKNAFGFFGAYDRVNNLIFPSNQGSMSSSVDQDVTGGVFRYRRDIGQNSALGALYTGRVAEDYFNHVMGLDGFFRLSRTKTLTFQYLHSETEYPADISLAFGQNAESFGGDAFRAEFTYMSREWYYTLSYRDLSPGFRADYGYIPRVDMRHVTGSAGRIIWGKPGDWYTRLNFSIDGLVVYDYDGELTDQRVGPTVTYMGPLQSVVQVGYTHYKELYRDELYSLNRGHCYFEIKPAGGLWFNVFGEYGENIDYQNARGANALIFMPFAELSLGRHVNINLMHSFQRLDLKGDAIFEANLSQVRFIYNFNTRTFVRAIFQYLDVARNPDLYFFPVEPETKTFFTQFLFSYKLNPQTVLFLGYSDNYLGDIGLDITRTDRTFFIKLGYAWTK